MPTHSAKITLRTDKKKADGTMPLSILIIVPGEIPYRKTTGLYVKPEHWDKEAGRVNKQHPNHISLNKMLGRELSRLENHIANLVLANQPILMSSIKKLYAEDEPSKIHLWISPVSV